MPLVTTTEMFKKAYDGGYAIGAFNVNNMEIVQGITEACREEKAPVILQVSKGARAYANHTYLVKLVEAAVIECPEIPIALHLDHGPDFETCKACIDGGFTSVMIDASSKPFAENIEITRKVVEYAHDHGVVVEAELGTQISAIKRGEDREMFKETMEKIHQPIPESTIVETIEAACDFGKEIGYPLIVRPAYTLGGTGGGIAENEEELIDIVQKGLGYSPIGQCLIERSIAGWKEIEYEVIRDAADNCITVCSMENLDPVGVHTGDYVILDAVPPVNMVNTPEIEGGIGTMAMIMNCIPHCINADAGLITMLDIPVPHAIMGDFRDLIKENKKIVK